MNRVMNKTRLYSNLSYQNVVLCKSEFAAQNYKEAAAVCYRSYCIPEVLTI